MLRVISVVAVSLLLAQEANGATSGSTKRRPSDSCAVDDVQKVDCGFSGIDQSGCESKGCCWAESSVSGTPWCFYQAGADTSCFGYMSAMKEPFSDSEVSTMRSFFMKNINIDNKGGVVAAPDTETPGGSYYYHWMRDGALTMRCLQETNEGSFSDIEDTVKSYVQWVLHVQSEADPNGIDVRTEPKFELPNGEVFSSGWCRPQNDGPGLRATTLMIAAQNLISSGQSDYVSEYLWTGDNSVKHGGAIKYDLDYIVDNYNTSTCDLWEEIRDPDFFWNRVTMKKALILGASFASMMKDDSTAKIYQTAMAEINATLYASHYNGAYVQECGSRPRDTAVILGFNDGYDESDQMFNPISSEVAQTVEAYNTLFCSEYSINVDDTSAGLPGVLYGRYAGDSYAGGNPWVLSTGALASLLYRGASEILDNGVPSADAMEHWKSAFNVDELPSKASDLATVFAAQADGVLLRLKKHVMPEGLHLYEQIDRNTGAQMSAEDLTWSYAEVLNAMYHRRNFLSKAKL